MFLNFLYFLPFTEWLLFFNFLPFFFVAGIRTDAPLFSVNALGSEVFPNSLNECVCVFVCHDRNTFRNCHEVL